MMQISEASGARRRKKEVSKADKLLPEVLRVLGGLTPGEFARQGGVRPLALSKHRRGEAALSSEQIEGLAAGAEVSLPFGRQVVATAVVIGTPFETSDGGDLAAEAACRLAAILGPTLKALETRPLPPPAEPNPDDPFGVALAEDQWRRLAKRTPAQRALIVEHGRQYQTEALLVRLCDESEDLADEVAREALEWAELAQRVAELAPGSAERRTRRSGYAGAFLANARRAAGQLPAAEAALALARRSFGEAAAEEAEEDGLLDPARLLGLESALRLDQGLPAGAQELLERALARCLPENRARLLLAQAALFGQTGESSRALGALAEARAAIEQGQGGPRLRWLLAWNLAKTLLQLERPAEAQAALAGLETLAEEIGGSLNLLRTRWITARVAAALGRTTEALAGLAEVRREFVAMPRWTDAAIAGLLEAEILLREDRTGKARTLVRAMKPVFESLGLKREALLACRRFVASVERETATATDARELAEALERAGIRGRRPTSV